MPQFSPKSDKSENLNECLSPEYSEWDGIGWKSWCFLLLFDEITDRVIYGINLYPHCSYLRHSLALLCFYGDISTKHENQTITGERKQQCVLCRGTPVVISDKSTCRHKTASWTGTLAVRAEARADVAGGEVGRGGEPHKALLPQLAENRHTGTLPRHSRKRSVYPAFL